MSNAYPSSEDTFLLMDVLKRDEALLAEGGVVIEIGCGSGEVSKMLSDFVGNNGMVISTDVNGEAIASSQHKVSNLICADLFTCFRTAQLFDVVVFNPPYVPTDEDEFLKSLDLRDISASWAGGLNGREVIDRFLRDVGRFLHHSSIVYLVVIDLNDVEDTIAFARSCGLAGEVTMERVAGIEKLYVVKLRKLQVTQTLSSCPLDPVAFM